MVVHRLAMGLIRLSLHTPASLVETMTALMERGAMLLVEWHIWGTCVVSLRVLGVLEALLGLIIRVTSVHVELVGAWTPAIKGVLAVTRVTVGLVDCCVLTASLS